MKNTTFRIPKMDCSAEEQMVRMKLEDMSYIKRLEFNLPERKLEVYHHGDSEEIARSLQELNLGAEWVGSVAVDAVEVESSQLSRSTRERKILWAILLINAGAFVLEMITGLISKSMGLVADSLDMLADAFVYSLSLYAVGRAASRKKQIAGISGYLQMSLAVLGMIEVFRRFLGKEEVPDFGLMIVISVIALIGNAVSLYLIQQAKSKEAHMEASYIFTSNDVIVNLGVILAGTLVFLTASKIPDLIIGAIVFVIVARGAVRILKLAR